MPFEKAFFCRACIIWLIKHESLKNVPKFEANKDDSGPLIME